VADNDAEIRKLQDLLTVLRKARDDSSEAIFAVESLIELVKRRRPEGTVTELRPGGGGE
jgi:hypothetical protein